MQRRGWARRHQEPRSHPAGGAHERWIWGSTDWNPAGLGNQRVTGQRPGWGPAESQMRGLGTPVSGGRGKTHLTGVEGPRCCGEQPLPLQLRPGLSGLRLGGWGKGWQALLCWDDSPVTGWGLTPGPVQAVGPFASRIALFRRRFTPHISAAPAATRPESTGGLDGELQTAGGGWSSQAPPCPCSCPSLRMRPQGSGRKAGGEGLGRAGAQGASWRRGLGTYRGRALSPPPLL